MKQFITLLHYIMLCVFSMNAYAYGPETKLLSSKIEMSKGMEGGFIEKETPLNLLANGGARAYAQANASYGKKGDNIRINGSHSFIIENRTGRAQNYTVEYKIMLSDGRFIRKSDTLLINNNAVERGSAISYTNQYFPSSGTFRFTVETTIRGEHSDYKSDANYIYVT